MKGNHICKIVTRNKEETLDFGMYIGSLTKPGYTICLTGDLGSGKTVLTGGIARGMGINEEITSPTFTLLNIYEGRIPLYHFDVYRLENRDMVQDIGFYDYVDGDGVSVIEWANLIPHVLPDSYILFDITRDFQAGDDFRSIDIYEKGTGMAELIEAIKNRRNTI